ncbi:pseudouridine synthase [Dipodascopsis uninucleata]
MHIQRDITLVGGTRHYIVINKPPGIYSQPNTSVNKWTSSLRSAGPSLRDSQDLLLNIREKYPELFGKNIQAPFTEPKLVHRLDYAVSGAMILALSKQAAQSFGRYFRKGGSSGWLVKKSYIACVNTCDNSPIISEKTRVKGLESCGNIGVISTPLTYEDGKQLECLTRYEVLHRDKRNNKALLRLELGTGRKHQLRRHCAEILLAPIVGDTRYDSDCQLHETQASSSPSQIALHSWKLDIKAGLDWKTYFAPVLWNSSNIWHDYIDMETGFPVL